MRAAVRTVGGLTALAVVLAGSVAGAGAASAAVSPSAPAIINEVYGGGGNGGATLKQDFIELYNPGASPVSLAGWSVQYASASGTSWATTALTGSIPAHSHYLVAEALGAGGSVDLPTPDVVGTIAMSGTAGKVALVNATTALACGSACSNAASVVDFVGYGTANDKAGTAPTPATSATNSVSRNAQHANTADNGADFTAGTPTPLNSGSTPTDPTDPGTPKTIAEIQGTGSASPLVGQTVTTNGVVTAAYPTGGINGYVIQAAGTGGPLGDATASQGLFVYSPSTAGSVTIGDHVEVTGAVSEFAGLTELTVTSAAGLTKIDDEATVTPTTGAWPTTAAGREALESMLFAPTGDWTISNTFSTNQYGEVGLASGTKPLIQPTDAARPGSPAAAAIEADNAARGVVLDDGATTNFLSAANQNLVPPYISLTNPVRVGAAATFTKPVIVDYRNDVWKLNPTAPVSTGGSPATFENDRTAAPENVGGDLKIASFNVLNYFTTLGATTSGCTSYKDRAGDGVTVNTGCDPRGAWDPADLTRQQTKIVAAINDLDADVVGLLEIENSLVVDNDADEALATLVAALNAAAGSDVWAFVPSSADLPPASQMDVITNAIIYRKAAVERTGASHALGTLSSGDAAFSNAREPIAQAFTPVGGGSPFLVVVNHFKSKGSAGPLPGDADSGDGQGASNASRVAQATALKNWVPTIQGDAQAVALVGDFNAYTHEDPLQVLYDAGYKDAASTLASGQYSYSFGGLSGSLDHVLLNGPALKRATGADFWEINAEESIALEYSRYNYHGALYYAPDEYRSSDHDPVVVGLEASAPPVDLTLLNINDFHGRIDANTVKFAGTVEKLRKEATGPVAFLSAGDNIGASLFASATANDKPTIDVLNTLELQASAVGNHEFDKGFADLAGRVTDAASWDYLGANVYDKGTTNPALDEYKVIDMDGVRVGIIGAVTQETPTLVTPGGIADLDFGDPVAAVNRVANQLTDGNEANGEADVLVAEYHEGAGAGTPDKATLEQEVAAGGAFADIVTKTSAKVDAIFTGHTHKQYAWEAPVPGAAGTTRPILQTGSYGEFVGKIVLTYDPVSGDVTAHTQSNVARSTAADADLVAAYPRVAQVKSIVDAALAYANTVGSVPVGSVTADITTAYSGGTYTGGKYTGGTRDDRANESSLGNLVANALRDTLEPENLGGAQIGVVNPGGLRAELFYAPDGVVTTAEANGVLPFVNNLWTTTLKGAQVITMLEQQWQTNADGTIPSRPYLQLGLSDNVAYTYDAAAAQGHHITSVTVDGQPLDPSADYRIGTFSFLAQGGDNFRVFSSGTGTKDSGLIDRDGWITYLQDHPNLAPSFARHSVGVPALPESVTAGEVFETTVSKLNLTSLGAPLNTSLDVKLDGTSIGSATVTDGNATVSVTIPADTSAGDHVLTLVASPSGTTVTLPLTVEAKAATETTTHLVVSGTPTTAGELTLTATVAPSDAAGTVTFRDGTTVIAQGVAISGGEATTTVDDLGAGEHALTAEFVPSSEAFAGSTSNTVNVSIAQATTTVLAVTGDLVVGGEQTLTATVSPASVSGTVTFRDGTTVLASGVAVVSGVATTATHLGVGEHSLTAQFVPSSSAAVASTSDAKDVTIAKATTSTSLVVTGGKRVGQTQTLTATVAPADVAGTVTFLDGTKVLKTVAVSGGKASTTASLTVGTHALTAVFTPADTTLYVGSTSAIVSITIAKSTSATSLTLKPTSTTFGSPVKATVTVIGSTSAPKGKVEIRDGKTVLLTTVLSTTGTKGTAKVTLPSFLTVGKHTLTAVYLGSATVDGSKGTATVKVTKATPTVKLSAAKWSIKEGASVSLTITVKGESGAPKPSGKVTVKVGGTTVGSAALSGGKATITLPKAKKSATVTVTYAGSASYTSAKASHKLTVR
ncbi:ExeM/NucH family extracellular endonuclease [Cellulomonas rhizosphaerae]|uniref:ExeM/NucH family extracellular endonuclease n=1 Tax=Cellulomonas rhizosphaerae TaxID=2293719 RepID=UPI000E558A08|nr:ExeM/NucH family extracellular endonuclease [Cellulomonas rhizosphaerae]